MKLEVLDKNGKKLEEMTLSDSVYAVTPHMDVLTQYIRIYQINQRQGTSSSKSRGEVSGSGKKLWPQKGTGRARMGSKRSPIWVHGGVAHGPKPRNWTLRMNKKQKNLAFCSALSIKAANKDLRIVENLKFAAPKTAEMLELLSNVKLSDKRHVLLVLDSNDMNTRRSAQNIPGVVTALVDNVNAYDLSRANALLMSKEAAKSLETKYKNESK